MRRYLLAIMFFPLFGFAQTQTEDIDITGLWKGTLYNDSTAQLYKYEIGISEEKGRLTGFSHTWYNDKGYFVVKKVKAKKSKGKIIIEDVDIIAYNYPEKPPKGVRRLHVLDLSAQDSLLILSGSFSTNQTKLYAPATGTLRLERKNDYRKHSDLLAHLQELKLEKELSFVSRDLQLAEEAEQKSLSKAPVPVQTSTSPVVTKTVTTSTSISAPAKIEPAKAKPLPVTRSEQPAAEVLTRTKVVQETMTFDSDSIEITLYDNGEVDGDTVSVLMNGTVLLAKQRLSTNAIRKSISIPAGVDSVELVMYAENLGLFPPNSGLLIIREGKEVHEVRFSGDLGKNAAVLLRRKK